MNTKSIKKCFCLLISSSLVISIGIPALAAISRISVNNNIDFSQIIRGGTEDNGKNILYVCTALFDGEYTPGKYYKPTQTCYVPWGGKERGITETRNFYIVGKDNSWEWKNFPGYIARNNPVLGTENNGSNLLYSCRAKVDGEDTPGKYYPPNQTCYVSWGGKEYTFKYRSKPFEILYSY